MDERTGDTTGAGAHEQTTHGERSTEEVAWDEEFAETRKSSSTGSMLKELAELAVEVPLTIIRMPFTLIPQETRRHGRAAVREGFRAVRSVMGALGDGIDNMLADPEERAKQPGGPEGTWGPRKEAPFTTASGGSGEASAGARRIDWTDDEGPAGGVGNPTEVDTTAAERADEIHAQAQQALDAEVADLDSATGEGRGLRSDINY